VSRDGSKVFGFGRADLGEHLDIYNNFCFTCFHIDPTITVAPNQSGNLKARLYCLDGGLAELQKRFTRDFDLNAANAIALQGYQPN